MFRANRSGGFHRGFFVEIENGDARAVSGEFARGRHTDAARRRTAGNNGDLAVEKT
jgi:hypothetical protein